MNVWKTGVAAQIFETPCIFITSTGRTGTQFFGYNTSRMIENCISLHEPDVLWLDRPYEWYTKIKEFGLFRMTLGKVLPRYSLRVLNIARHSGRLSDAQIVEYLRHLRLRVLAHIQPAVYVEANSVYGSLVDLLPRAFPNSRIVYIIRDPRVWVRSWMNMRIPFYSWRDVRSWFPHGRLAPHHIKGDPYLRTWRHLGQFEKLCWAWARENALALECASRTEAAKVFRFEDLFSGDTAQEHFVQLLRFVTRFPNGFEARWVFKPELLSQKVHSTSDGAFPGWRMWESKYVQQLDRHCRGLMERFGYGQEPEWQEKLRALTPALSSHFPHVPEL